MIATNATIKIFVRFFIFLYFKLNNNIKELNK
jgi:hypothetical protein